MGLCGRRELESIGTWTPKTKQDNTFFFDFVFEIGLGVPSKADSDELATVVALAYKQQRHMMK